MEGCRVSIPFITSIDPTSGAPDGGVQVVISGQDLIDVTSVTFGGTDAASFSVDDDSQVSAETPAGLPEGDLDVVVSNAEGSSDALTFIVVSQSPAPDAPTIDSVDPSSVDSAGGTVTVTGTGFTDVTGVTIGGVDAPSFSVDSDTQISVETPPLQLEGDVALVVSTGAGSASASVTVSAGCTVTNFDVPVGRSGCTQEGGKVGERFRMEADFTAACSCCEYRQFVRGSFTANGRPVRHLLPDPAGGAPRPMLPRPGAGDPGDNFLEDGVASPPAGVNAFYGHRTEGNTDPTDKYLPDRADGCQYRGNDFPGLRGASGMTYTIDLDFRGQIIDRCNSDAVKNASDWTVSCSGTI